MRNFTLLLISGLLCSSINYAQTDQTYTRPNADPAKSGELIMNRFTKSVGNVKSNENSIWRPKSEIVYMCDPEGENPDIEWFEVISAQYTYDERGNVLSIESEDLEGEPGESRNKTLTKYDAHNNIIERVKQVEKEGELVNEEKTEFEYDDIVTDFVIRKTTYEWDDVNNDWKRNYEHQKQITRDAKNNITQILIKVLNYDGVTFADHDRTDIAYDEATGKAKTWTIYTIYDDGPAESLRFDNIIWENTNGQIVESNDQFVLGNNRIKEAKLFREGNEVGTYSATFTGEKDFVCTINTNQINKETSKEEYVSEVHTYQILNEKGDLREGFIYKTDLNADKIFTDDEITGSNYKMWKYDEKGNLIMSAAFSPAETGEVASLSLDPIAPEPGMEQTDGEMTEYTYNEYGEATSRIVYMWFWEPGGGQYLPLEKYVTSDFYDVTTGLETTRTESGKLTYSVSTDGEMTFSMEGMNGYVIYNANGTSIVNAKTSGSTASESIANLPAGLYILKVTGTKGAETVKFLKR